MTRALRSWPGRRAIPSHASARLWRFLRSGCAVAVHPPWFENNHGGFGRAARGVLVEVLVDLAPAGPQPRPFGPLSRARADLTSSVTSLGGGVGIGLQVQPPRGFSRTPAVHGERDQVVAILEVPDHNRSRQPGAAARRREPQGT